MDIAIVVIVVYYRQLIRSIAIFDKFMSNTRSKEDLSNKTINEIVEANTKEFQEMSNLSSGEDIDAKVMVKEENDTSKDDLKFTTDQKDADSKTPSMENMVNQLYIMIQAMALQSKERDVREAKQR